MNKNKFITIIGIINIIFGLFIGIICANCFLADGVEDSVEYNKHANSYYSIDYDYAVPYPIYSQIAEMRKLDSVDKVYYYYEQNISFSTETNETMGVALFSPNTDIYLSGFNDRRVIKALEIDPVNYIYIDERTSEVLDVDLSDTINISFNDVDFINLTVSRIYYDDLNYTVPEAYISYRDDVKTFINETKISQLIYKEALVKASSNMLDECFTDLSTYGPMAKMKTIADFTTEDEYNEYVSEFNSTDYSSTIVKSSDKLTLVNETYGSFYTNSKRSYVISMILIAITFPLSLIEFYFIKKYNNNRIYKHGLPGFTEKELFGKLSLIAVFSLVIEAIAIYAPFYVMSNSKQVLYGYIGNTYVYIALGLVVGILTYMVSLTLIIPKLFIEQNSDSK